MQSDVTIKTRKRTNKYSANLYNNHKKRKVTLESGMTGFLCTCNFRERGCITDAYKLLNMYANEEPGSEIIKISEKSASSTFDKKCSDQYYEDTDEDQDISTALKNEISKLKTEYQLPVSSRKFQVVDTGVKNMIFITSILPNPLELVTKIITELDTTKKQCSRFLLRLLPIELTCKAYMDDIRTKANTLFEKYFSQEPKTFSIVFNRHSNNSIKRNDIIEDLAEIIMKKNPGNKANLKNPEIAVVITVIRGICLFSIAPNYYKFKKYNLLEICSGGNKVIFDKKATVSANEKTTETNLDTDVSITQDVEEPISENYTLGTNL